MSSTVWFGLLGPVDIRLDGVPVPLPSARTRALLAALLCQPNRVVSVDGLVDAVWGADPPDGALTTLRSHVMRLRRCLGPEAGRLQTAAPGYRLLLDPTTELDTRMFVARHQAGQLAAAAGDWRSAARYAAEALALWRGEPLADVPSEQLQLDEAAAWAELRVEAIELRARADISLGRPADAAAAMRRLAADHPHREPAYALLMAALAAADRRAEALQVYRLLRTVLVRDLGMEPSPELRALQQRILAMDDSADDADDADDGDGAGGIGDGIGDGNGDGPTGDSTPRDEAGTAYVAWPPPHTLPRDVADFTGRGEQLRHITDAAAGPADPHTAFAAVIDGMAGIGKSALAVHAAHQLSDRFPDGQLYADLLGTSPEPAEPRAVLASFLRLLGISPAELPEPDMERAGLYRSLLAGRRVLVVLDDVRDSRQLAPLIPATPGCALLATTRDRHVGIAGALRLSLGTLTLPESHALLTRIVGPDRTAEEPEATDELLAACAGSPLAIRAAGGRISARPTWQIADLATRVGVPGRRLDELRFADYDVRAGFEAGFAALAGLSDSAFGAGPSTSSSTSSSPGLSTSPSSNLSPSSENTLAISLCQLGLWSGGELGLSVAATLLGRPAPETEEILERLVDLNLLQAPRHGRYLLPDLVREFAAEKAQNLLTEEQRRAAAELWRLPRARSVKTPSSRKTPSSS